MDTLTETLERILEIAEITDNIRAAVANGELTEEQGKEVLDSVLDVVIHLPYKTIVGQWNERTLQTLRRR